MAIQQSSFFCPVCQQQRLFTRQKGVNHILHLLFTLFSCGLWAFVWLILTVSDNPRYHCSQCGHSDSVKYLTNPYLRSQEAQQKAERAALRGQSSSPSSNSFTEWFSGLDSRAKTFMIGLAAVGVLFVIGLGYFIKNAKTNRQSNSQANATNTSNASNKTIASAPASTPAPTTLSASENLALGKKALGDGNLSTARSHLSAIPKDAKEFASAKQYLATVAKREQRKSVENELESVESQIANQEDMMNRTEDGEGSIGKSIYANALKRKAELQLQRIKLERKLKSMP